MHFMEFAFLNQFPECSFRSTSGNTGCVIHFNEDADHELYSLLTHWLRDFFDYAECQGPLPPPSNAYLLTQKVKDWSAQSMIVMAILGWILPILPGTPFFLLAWWLGWRPSPKQTSVVVEP